MNQIKEISPDDLYMVTEPGVTTYALQQAVENEGLFDPNNILNPGKMFS